MYFLSWTDCVGAGFPKPFQKLFTSTSFQGRGFFLGLTCRDNQDIPNPILLRRFCFKIPDSFNFKASSQPLKKISGLFYRVLLPKMTNPNHWKLWNILTNMDNKETTLKISNLRRSGNFLRVFLFKRNLYPAGMIILGDVKSKLSPFAIPALWLLDFLRRATNERCYKQDFSHTEASAISTPFPTKSFQNSKRICPKQETRRKKISPASILHEYVQISKPVSRWEQQNSASRHRMNQIRTIYGIFLFCFPLGSALARRFLG